MAVSVQPEARLLGDDFVEAAERALSSGQPGQVSDAELERVMTAAVTKSSPIYASSGRTVTAITTRPAAPPELRPQSAACESRRD